MIEMTQMTEPAVIPAPKTKPVPKRKPKERPRRDDPWTVPAPKVNPTPKALNKTVMKKLVKTISEYRMLRELMKTDAFFEKFTVCDSLAVKIAAEDAMANANDSQLELQMN